MERGVVWRIGGALALLLSLLLFGGIARGATGDLSALGCLSGDSATAPRCDLTPEAFSTGVSSGLDGIQSVDVSPNGESVYATSQQDDSIVHLTRDPDSNTIAFSECITGETNSAVDSCTAGPTVATVGADTGFDGMAEAVVSPGGTSVYAIAQNDDAVIHFDRDPGTGALTFASCISAETATVAGPCEASAIATSGTGAETGLDFPSGIAINPGGTNLYVTSLNDDAIARFTRFPATGLIAAVDCISADSDVTSCTAAQTTSPDGTTTGLSNPHSPIVSADGDNVYMSSNGDASVAWFDRAPSGTLSWGDCITGETGTGPMPSGNDACGTAVPSATASGANSGLERTQTVVEAPGGGQVYAGSQTDSAVYYFARDGGSGDLNISGCLTGEEAIDQSDCSHVPTSTPTGSESGLHFLESLAVSADGKSLYAAGSADASIAIFDRTLSNGEIEWDGCVTGEDETGPSGSGSCTAPAATAGGAGSGLNTIRSVAVSPDGLQIIGGTEGDDSVVFADRSIAPQTTLASGPPAFSNDPTATFTFSADESPVTFQCRVDSGPFGACSGAGSHTTGNLPDGAHTFQVRARNAVPTADPTPASSTFTVDTAAPDTTISSGPEGITGSSSAEFAFTATGASQFACRLDGEPFAACTSPKAYSLPNGSHTFEVRAEDAAGNIDGSPATQSFSIDTVQPDTSITTSPKKTVRTDKEKKKATFRFITTEPGTFECKRDKGKDFKPCTAPYKKKYKRGKHTFTVRAIDEVGNVGTSDSHTWKVKRKK